MEIISLTSPDGTAYDPIPGQVRYCWARSGYDDFYDMPEILSRGGCRSAAISFLDTVTGEIHKPFGLVKNVIYGRPIISEGFIYFLRGDFNANTASLMRCEFGKEPEKVYIMSLDGVDLYNLGLCGYPVHIVSQSETLSSYYPERFAFPLEPNESLEFIEDGRIYLSAWIEEGVENGAAGDNYRFFNKYVVKDRNGRTLEEALGCLNLYGDGKWRIT